NVLSVPLNAVTTRSKKDEAPKSGDDKKSDKPAETNAAGENKVADDDIEEVVFVLQKDNTVKKFKVKTAVQDLNYIEVIEGIKAGDQVVTGPYNTVSKLLKEGDKVKVVEKDKLYEDKDKKN
ncbi:MAG TPA: efflux transporter periplasmic adaptor subunit, partial [Chitinophagaceae bacterium]|nr:efflux transporter periplasmic adaptor subunit [Chitinophagaceae bacterium]